MTPSSQKRPAIVPNTVVFAKVNTSAMLQCGTDDGLPWNLCVWERKPAGQRSLVVIDVEVAQTRTPVKGISYIGDGVDKNGKCQVRIESTKYSDFGQWSCTLMTQNGAISTGQLYLRDGMAAQALLDVLSSLFLTISQNQCSDLNSFSYA